jgi:hypothetical protein
LKGNYVEDVLKVLAEKNIKSKSGKAYSGKMISHILNGKYENLFIEKAIFDVYLERKIKFENEEKERNQILGINASTKT